MYKLIDYYTGETIESFKTKKEAEDFKELRNKKAIENKTKVFNWLTIIVKS